MAAGSWGCVGAQVARPSATFPSGPSLARRGPAGRPLPPRPPRFYLAPVGSFQGSSPPSPCQRPGSQFPFASGGGRAPGAGSARPLLTC